MAASAATPGRRGECREDGGINARAFDFAEELAIIDAAPCTLEIPARTRRRTVHRIVPTPIFRAAAVSSPKDLKNAGLKATVPRLKIIRLFETSKARHLTAEDVYRKLLAEGPDIGLATVYRVLTQFEQAGILVRHHFDSGKAVFELNEGHHHDHLVCLKCGRVEEFYDAAIEKRQTVVARERGFEISGHALYLYAECVKPRCPHRKGGRAG